MQVKEIFTVAKLTLETTFSDSFRAISSPEHATAIEGFKAFNRRMRFLGRQNDGRISLNSFRELIRGYDKSEEVADVGRAALAQSDLFLPGFSGIVMVGDFIDAVHDDPNPDPTLKSYGPGLMWASLKLAQERLATTVASATGATKEGYEAVNSALAQKPLEDIAYKDRHHIGGNGLDFYIHPDAPSLRRCEKAIAIAGISGVLPKPNFHSLVLGDPNLTKLASEAHETGVLGGFTGNLFAGSVDSSLAAHILLQLYGTKSYTTKEINRPFEERVVNDILRRHDAGINVH
jgi:hypothetical protein